MKNFIIKGTMTIASMFLTFSTFAQLKPNPRVFAAAISQNPIDAAEDIWISFNIANSGGIANPHSFSAINISLQKLAPNASFNIATDIVGPNYYEWVYSEEFNMFIGELVNPMPAGVMASTQEYKFKNLISTGTSYSPNPENGFKVAIDAPQEINSNTSTDDDEVKRYVPSNVISTFTPLPTELASFSVKASDCIATLNWMTFSEKNSKFFGIEVSTDARTFTEIARIDAAGSSELKNNYHFNHKMKPNTSYFFRLKMIDQDNSFCFSNIETTSCNISNPRIITISPNPTSSNLRIEGLNNENYRISLIDIAGRQLFELKTIKVNSSILNLNEYPTGLYILKVQDDEGNFTNFKVNRK